MDTKIAEYETQRLDHLGIVAGICKQIGLIEIIDESLPSPVARKVSCGQATQAMILNALGFTSRALYLMPEYMQNKPVELLIGEGLEADDFNDDTLGRALDELQQAGVTGLFARIANDAARVFNLESDYVHVDTSSISVQGTYDSEYAVEMSEKYETAKVTYGYSKDKRPDLKQVVVTLITSQASSIPMWLEVLDGNSSDKTSFNDTITAYCDQLTEGEEPPCFVMDSAAYTLKNLQSWEMLRWLTRVPETIGEAKAFIQKIATEEMSPILATYRLFPMSAH
jgi:transposase